MKKPKVVKPFSFNGLSNQQVVDILNNDNPINIKYNENLVDRVHARYPLIDKVKISIIIKLIVVIFKRTFTN